jgi:hypothetical protein
LNKFIITNFYIEIMAYQLSNQPNAPRKLGIHTAKYTLVQFIGMYGPFLISRKNLRTGIELEIYTDYQDKISNLEN